MLVSKLNPYCNVKTQKLPPKCKPLIPANQSLTSNDTSFKSLWMPGNLSFKGVLISVPQSTLVSNVPKFNPIISSYRAKLAKAISTNAENLASVLEPDELVELIKNAKYENFSSGYNFENVLNGLFNFNFHIHTEHSDGRLQVKRLLDQAVNFAKYRKSLGKTDPVVVAITDHDTLEGSREAIRIIANNPQKYQDIRFIPGIEFNAHHNARQLEIVGYCINPFDEKLNAFIESGREKNKQYLQNFLETQVNQWEAKANIPQSERTTLDKIQEYVKRKDIDCGQHLQYLGSGGLMMGFTNALKSIFAERNWRFDGINIFSHEHGLKYKSFAINPGTPSVREIAQVVKDSASGFVGVAHPCRNLGDINLVDLFNEFKTYGVDSVEANYQYANVPKAFKDYADLSATQVQMLKTGGQDNHTNNIFTNSCNMEDLPEEVKATICISVEK